MIPISKKQFIKNNKYLLNLRHEISIGISCLSFNNVMVVAWNDSTDRLTNSSYSFVAFKLNSIETIYDLVNGLDVYCEYI